MALSRMSDQIGRVLDGRYRLVAPIGTGASGRVYLADDVRLRRRVAIKVLHPSLADDQSFLRRFQAEAHAAAALNHPHVMAVYDWGRDEVPYLVTEYLGGGSMRAMLDRGSRLTVSQALLVGLEATRGLDYAHRRGFVHRDVKPANLLFGDDARLRIADFGLARALAEAGWTEPSGAVLGTARYASPEQAQGEMVDGKADVYALGLTLIEAVSGSVPFAADTTIATLMARVDTPVDIDDSFGPLRPVLERACHPEPGERPDAGALAVAFMAAAETLPRPAPLPLAGAVEERDLPAEPVDPTNLGADPDPTVADPLVDAGAEGHDEAGKQPSARARRKARRAARREERRVAKAAAADGRVAGGEGADARRGRRRWPWVLMAVVIAAVVGLGTAYAVNLAVTPPSYPVDDYVGADADEVVALVADHGWTVTLREDRQTGSDVGEVLRQDPAPGVEMEEGADSELVLWASIGNDLVPAPTDLELLPREEAEQRILDAGFAVGQVTEDHSEDVEAGHVLSVGHAEELVDGQLPEGSAVDLVVSLGPEPRTVPGVPGGATYEDVAGELESVQLVAERVTEPSQTAPEGVVIRTEPGEGAEVPRGDTVRVVVSSGLPFVTVPDVSGESEQDATARLRAEGLAIGDRNGPPQREVLATDPPAGESVRQGTEVIVITRST